MSICNAGGWDDAMDEDNLDQLEITHVVNCAAKNADMSSPYPHYIKYCAFKGRDHPDYDIVSYSQI